ncbi:DUF7089 family protein [Natronocalculus amylovorans]|uniref:Uncharacterized protein n=1 Tax=Natronocalculus amylovorans TaxID=2917812 RepID=A0AAE3K7J1_9EURY|nr:hypothetical protein [Natronocalculus amylovorans]MCL9816058.1 hypothetical protein [Natronocalculus amylovorans]NUE01423.1 hypothetical protein [Halorubraceae archaeon YAN]
MFTERSLSEPLSAVHKAYAPDALTFSLDTDSEMLPPAVAEELGLVVESLSPAQYPASWLPSDAPQLLQRYASSDFTIGMPGDGTVMWTTQTTPPCVFTKHRATGTPDAFLDFLLAEAYVQLHLAVPEHFLPYFGEQYRELAAVSGLSPGETYQLAAALFDGWVGLQTRSEFRSWETEHPALWESWVDAGERLEGRLDSLSREVAHGKLTFAEATEYACSAMKHDLKLPAPFSALNTTAYIDHGPSYAVRWAEKTFAQLRD